MNFEQARFNMVEQQIRPWDVLDFDVLDALQDIPRELFVQPSQQGYAYADLALPLPNGSQMLEPKIVGRMAQGLALKKHERVLEIGTGSGYATAVLAKLAHEVTTCDIDGQQLNAAQAILKGLQLDNIRYQAIAGYLAHARPDANIYAVELSPEALTYTHTNLDPLGVTIIAGDATNPTLLEHLNGKATAVVTNPPYVPHTTDLQPEVYADPPMAVFGGDTGMDVITRLIPTARRLLAPGGVFACEHDDTTGPDVVKLVAEAGLRQVTQHQDWAGQPRFVTAICDSTD